MDSVLDLLLQGTKFLPKQRASGQVPSPPTIEKVPFEGNTIIHGFHGGSPQSFPEHVGKEVDDPRGQGCVVINQYPSALGRESRCRGSQYIIPSKFVTQWVSPGGGLALMKVPKRRRDNQAQVSKISPWGLLGSAAWHPGGALASAKNHARSSWRS